MRWMAWWLACSQLAGWCERCVSLALRCCAVVALLCLAVPRGARRALRAWFGRLDCLAAIAAIVPRYVRCYPTYESSRVD